MVGCLEHYAYPQEQVEAILAGLHSPWAIDNSSQKADYGQMKGGRYQ